MSLSRRRFGKRGTENMIQFIVLSICAEATNSIRDEQRMYILVKSANSRTDGGQHAR